MPELAEYAEVALRRTNGRRPRKPGDKPGDREKDANSRHLFINGVEFPYYTTGDIKVNPPESGSPVDMTTVTVTIPIYQGVLVRRENVTTQLDDEDRVIGSSRWTGVSWSPGMGDKGVIDAIGKREAELQRER